MSPLIRKEIRLILPFWAIAMALTIVPAWLFPTEHYLTGAPVFLFWTFYFGLIVLGLAPFGNEFSLGTFSGLLAQPVERRRIWTSKIAVITISALLVLCAFVLTVHLRLQSDLRAGAEILVINVPGWSNHVLVSEAVGPWMSEQFWQVSKIGAALLCLALTGGLWTTLLFRQTGAALWFVILVPGVLFVLTGALVKGPSDAQDFAWGTMLLCYSVAGFVWAWRMFAGAQDSQWLGENVALLSLSPAKRRAEDTAAPRRPGALRALVRKEFQSHQISLLVAFGLLVLHICTLAIRHFVMLSRNSELRFTVEAVPTLWLLVPWLIGSVAVAEERKLGIMESQLCLPIARRWQFAIKLAIVLLLSMVLGGLMPGLVEGLGQLAGVSSEIVGSVHAPGSLIYFTTAFKMVLGAAAIAMVAFFASTLCRNTLHALGAAIFFGGVLSFLFEWVIEGAGRYEYALWKGPLVLFTSIPVAIIAGAVLSFSNYKTLHPGGKVWFRNLFILTVSLVFTGIATAFVYQRPWELAMSLEPRHGTPCLSGPIQPAVCSTMGRIFVLLPDGRLWTGADYRWQEFNGFQRVSDNFGSNYWKRLRMELPASGTFIGGSNWVALAASANASDVGALQSDGTLWKIFTWRDQTNRSTRLSFVPQPRRIGADSDWISVATCGGYYLAVKKNGTLWGWGNNDQQRLAPDSRLELAEPEQIGTNSDWAAVFERRSDPLLMKTDGSIFEWTSQSQHLVLNRTYLNGRDWLAVAGSRERNLVLRSDGTLWASGHLPSPLFGVHFARFEFAQALTRIGDRSDWSKIDGDYSVVAAIRSDGSLVKSDTELFSFTLGQPSRYSDWIALQMGWDNLLALASDGTLSLWVDTRLPGEALLAPTDQPLWSMNIFTGQTTAAGAIPLENPK